MSQHIPPSAVLGSGCRTMTRWSALVAGMAGALTSGLVSAALVGTLNWGSDVDAYNTFATNCATTGCPTTALQPNDTVLFSWGLAQDTANSRTSWRNTGASFVLDRIRVTATANNLGSGIVSPSSGGQGYTTGQGAAPTWEWSSMAYLTQMVESQLGISHGSASVSAGLFGTTYQLRGYLVFLAASYLTNPYRYHLRRIRARRNRNQRPHQFSLIREYLERCEPRSPRPCLCPDDD